MKITTFGIISNGFYAMFAAAYFLFYMTTGIMLVVGLVLIGGHLTNTPTDQVDLHPYDTIYGNLLVVVSICESVKAFRWIRTEVTNLAGVKHEDKQNNV